MKPKKIIYKSEAGTAARAADTLLNLLYPRKCPLCRDILTEPGQFICPDCAAALQPLAAERNRCIKCSRPVRDGEEYCSDCRTHSHLFTEGAAVFPYEDTLRTSVLTCKYGGHRQFADFYAQAMNWELQRCLPRWQPHALIPIPAHPRKRRERGFNLPDLLADRISASTGIPSCPELLSKTRLTHTQKQLTGEARRSNLSGSFAVTTAQPLTGARLLLIDDVYTTGSTIDAAAEPLLKAGTCHVYFLTLCIGRGYQ